MKLGRFGTSRTSTPSEVGRGIDASAGERPYRFLARVAHGLNSMVTTKDFHGQAHVPAAGGAIVVANHNSNYDALVIGDFLIWSGRWPRFLGKVELWSVPVVRYFARTCRQIPVERGTSHAVDSLRAAREAIEGGELVVFYPEGTVGTDPEGWPVSARTGAARLALQTRCPVIPLAQWGAQDIIGKKVTIPHYWPRKTVAVLAGEPVDLSDLYDAPDQQAAARVATERMMVAITELVARLRGLPVPSDRYDVRRGVRVPLGATSLTDDAAGLV